MKIPRKKKNDRTAFFFMNPVEYFKFRRKINPERRLDRQFPAATLIHRDRLRAAAFRKEFKEGPGIPLDALLKPLSVKP